VPSVNGYARSKMCVLASRSTGNRLRFTARLPEGIPKNEVTLGELPPADRGCHAHATNLGLRLRVLLTVDGAERLKLVRV